MADTAIEWTGRVWNPVAGCSVLSPGCTNCYAMKLAGGRLQHHPTRKGLTAPSKAGPVWTGEVRLNADQLTLPLRWTRPRRIFVCAHGDLFHESVPDAWIDQVFAVMALTPQHTYQVLTKRAARMRAYAADPATPGRIARAIVDMLLDKAIKVGTAWPVRTIGDIDYPDDITIDWPLANVWKGVSAEDQARADERISELLATPAAVRFLSAEPLLGAIDLEDLNGNGTVLDPECWGDCACDSAYGRDPGCRRNGGTGYLTRRLDWVIVGGESGPDARPMHPDWPRQIRDQCAAAGAPFFFKQWGAWTPGENVGGANPNFGAFYDADAGRWHFTVFSPAALDGLHVDDEPDLWSVGKKAAGRLLDGKIHDARPEVNHG